MKKKISIFCVIFLLLVSCGIIAKAEEPLEIQKTTPVKAKVLNSQSVEKIQQNEIIKTIQKATIRIEEGEYENEELEMEYILQEDENSLISYSPLKKDEQILVTIQETEGEIKTVSFKEKNNFQFVFVIIAVVLLVLVIILDKAKSMKMLCMYFTFMISIVGIFFLAIIYEWNLVLIASIIAVIATIAIYLRIDGKYPKTLNQFLIMIISIFAIGAVAYVVLDTIGIFDFNIKIAQKFTNLQNLICAVIILLGCGTGNIIKTIFFLKDTIEYKSYKTKSDNIIEGQRSLKL